MVSRRNDRSDNSLVNRRSLLIGGLGVAAFGINYTAFTTGNASRGLTYEIGADDSNSSVLTLINADSVERNQTNQLAIKLANNTQYTASVTAQLQTQDVIDTVSFTNSTTQNRSTISFTLAGGNTREIFVDVNNNNTADLLQYQLTVDLNEFTTTLTREDTQIVNNTNQTDPNPEPGQIDVVVTQKGNSSNYSADWSVGGDTTNFDRI